MTNETNGGESSSEIEVIRKRNASLIGVPRSEETKQKISNSNKKPKTEAHRQAVKKAMIETFGIRINQYSVDGVLIKTWDSISSAAETLNVSSANIAKCVAKQEHYNSAYGFVWRKVDDPLCSRFFRVCCAFKHVL